MKTQRQIIDDLFRSNSPYRAGLRDSPWSDTLIKWMGQGYPSTSEGKPVSPAEHFNFDMVGVGGFPWEAKLQDHEVIEQTEEWQVVRDGNGASFKWWKDKSGTPQHIDFAMSSREIWEKEYKPHVTGSARKRATPEKINAIKENLRSIHNQNKWADFGFRGLWENMRAAFGDINLYESMLLDPEWIKDYCRAYTDLYKEEFLICIEEAGKPDGVWFFDDLGYKEAVFCDPELFERLIFPFYTELNDLIHSHDIPSILHTCGFTEPVLHLIVDSGFDGLHPMEVKAGNDPLRIADTYADKLVFIGGLDARILETHDREHIRKEVTAYITGMKDRGARLVFGSDHSLSTIIDYDDFLYTIDVYREHMLYG